ncbi:MAG: MerR family transcriptional regulator [Gammaproteobacteria bacterium]
MDDGGETYPMRTVAKLTGVNPVTLRAWERRYGLIRPLRAPSGHRTFRREDIERIHRINDLVSRGLAIGQVRGALDAARRASPDTARDGVWPGYLERCIAALARFDAGALDDAFDTVFSIHTVATATERLLIPLLVEVGRRWSDGEGTIAQEHFLSVYVRNKIGALVQLRSRRGNGPTLVCACTPGQQHEIGLLLFVLAAQSEDFGTIVLGPNLPLAEIAAVVRQADARGVVLSCPGQCRVEVLDRDLAALVAAAGVPVFLGGEGSLRHQERIAAAGAVALGMEFGPALRRIRSALPPRVSSGDAGAGQS